MIKCIQSKQKQCLCWAINGKYAAQIQLKRIKKCLQQWKQRCFEVEHQLKMFHYTFIDTTHNFIFP